MALKRGMKDVLRMGDAYLSKPRSNKYRANSQIKRGMKSVSIVSLSPNDNLNYGKDMVLYNPYSKGVQKQKIHLPYLKKNRRVAPRIREDNRHTRLRGDRSVNNASIDILTTSNKK